VGRTGAGKTTIINTLLGVTEISKGKILLDGTPID
jgi:ABC-type multidrug transport system fused ATPase/permease subunit